MRFILVCVIAQITFSSNLYATEIKGNPEELRKFLHPQQARVSLNAQVERRVYADQALVSVVVKNESKTLAKAMQENANLRDTLKNSLVAASVSANDIKNSQFSSSPQYGWFGDKPKSFEVINRVVVAITNEQALQALATVTDKYDEMSIAGTEFKHTAKDEVHNELKKEAIKKILVDKTYYENTLNVTLKTFSFHDSGLIIGTTNGEMAVEKLMVSNNRVRKDNSSSLAYEDNYQTPEKQSFEEIKYTASVRVEFEISERKNEY